jgi:hypothetical protein
MCTLLPNLAAGASSVLFLLIFEHPGEGVNNKILRDPYDVRGASEPRSLRARNANAEKLSQLLSFQVFANP